MSHITIIAEKPSVAMDIARIVGANKNCISNRTGWVEGNGYKVTWAFGHLITLKSPEQIGFGGNVLPIFPDEWATDMRSESDAVVKRQLGVIEKLFNSSSRIIVATDAGREGELIFRYIYEYLGCTVPFDRLWISSMTDEAIRKGFDELRPGASMEPLSLAAHARSEADWLLGYNASRALRVASGSKRTLSLGRVQTPVLKMICDRYLAFKNFTPTPYWQLKATLHKDMQNVDVLSSERYGAEQPSLDALALCEKERSMTVTKVEKKDVTTKPPYLHDLTSLQQTANRRLGLTADQTLKIAQTLYEKKYLTYPRTGSSFIPEDVFRTIPSLIRKVAEGYEPFSGFAASLDGMKLCRKSVNDEKVTDHHALLPTPNIPTALTGDEKAVWELVCGRMLEAFGPDSVSAKVSVNLDCAGIEFHVGASSIRKAGWKAVFGVEETDGNEENRKLPEFKEGERVDAANFESLGKTDKPQPLYDDDSLLNEMKYCGKHIEDEELRETMKDIGLGTSATRAATIEILVRREYIKREKKKIIPTELGLHIYELVKDKRIADVRTSGEWEQELALIEQGKKSKASFDKGIRQFTLDVIEDIREGTQKIDEGSFAKVAGNCPVCGKKLSESRYGLWCNPKDGGCGMSVPYVVCGKTLPEGALRDLIEKGVTKPMKFRSKAGNVFEMRLAVDRTEKKVIFHKDASEAAKMEGRICPCCGAGLEDRGRSLTCECGFQLWKRQCEVALSEEQIDMILSGKKVLVKGMKSKSGKKFDAYILIDTKEKKTTFVFPAKQ